MGTREFVVQEDSFTFLCLDFTQIFCSLGQVRLLFQGIHELADKEELFTKLSPKSHSHFLEPEIKN